MSAFAKAAATLAAASIATAALAVGTAARTVPDPDAGAPSAASSVAASAGPPRRVASINLCADQLLLELAAPGQILSLSRLATDPAASHHVARAAGLPTNDGGAESVLALDPDVVLVGEYSDRYTVRLLEARGLDVRTLPLADSVEATLANLELVGGWIGREGAARDRVRDLRERLDAVEREKATATGKGTRPLAAVYDPNGYTVGPSSLRGEMLARAGFANVAEQAGIEGYGSLALETLLRRAPDVLIDSPYSAGTWSRAQALATHPALRSRGLDPGVVTLASADTICGGPWTVDLIERLARERRAIERRAER